MAVTGAEHRPRDAERPPRTLPALVSGLWFPLFFFVGFAGCYLLPLHAPSPHHVTVAVASPGVARSVGASLGQADPGAFSIQSAGNAASVREMVLDQGASAGYSQSGDSAVLYTASAGGAALTSVVTTTLDNLAARNGTKLRTVDLVPTASGDPSGTGLLYLALLWNLVPYMAALMLLRHRLSRRTKTLTFAGLGAVISVAGYILGVAVHIIPAEPLAILYAFLLTQAVALATFGLAPLCGRLLPGAGLLLFVLLSVPSCGGAIPVQLVPAFFRVLHPVMPLGDLIDALRDVLYFQDGQLLRPTVVLVLWIAAGAALTGAFGARKTRAELAAGRTR